MYTNESMPISDILKLADAAVIVVPSLLLGLLVWLAARVGSFMARLFSADDGMIAREQKHRHRLENFASRMTLLCFIAGLVIIATGHGGGMMEVKDIKLPGGVEIGSAGAGVMLIGVGNSLLWMLLSFRKPKEEAEEGAGSANTSAITQGDALHHSPATRWLASMSYWQVAVITLVLCLFMNLLAIPAGAFLAWQVAKSRKSVAQQAQENAPRAIPAGAAS